MALTVHLNCSEDDLALGVGGDWVEFSQGNDYIIYSAGSDTVKDGESIPSETQLISAGSILSGVQQIVPKYFLADISENELREIPLMGDQNARYVMAFDFDGSTASEPVLELWDNRDCDSIDDVTLGEGTAANSWWRGVVTTNGLPGDSWIGSHLAGSGFGYYLLLNGGAGALSVAKTLYCAIKIIIPASVSLGGNVMPPFVCKFLSAS